MPRQVQLQARGVQAVFVGRGAAGRKGHQAAGGGDRAGELYGRVRGVPQVAHRDARGVRRHRRRGREVGGIHPLAHGAPLGARHRLLPPPVHQPAGRGQDAQHEEDGAPVPAAHLCVRPRKDDAGARRARRDPAALPQDGGVGRVAGGVCGPPRQVHCARQDPRRGEEEGGRGAGGARRRRGVRVRAAREGRAAGPGWARPGGGVRVAAARDARGVWRPRHRRAQADPAGDGPRRGVAPHEALRRLGSVGPDGRRGLAGQRGGGGRGARKALRGGLVAQRRSG
mmetsp:Transcript_26413/g.84674  ORF Transcript_26413/g.84674 Transcript_26413/m.84674 type:complete len:283 (-) Transcript_26413:318-1166(-)